MFGLASVNQREIKAVSIAGGSVGMAPWAVVLLVQTLTLGLYFSAYSVHSQVLAI